MLVHQLKRLEPFAHLRWNDLDLIAQHTQLLCIPRSRWLLREGRRLTGVYFLAHGRLRLWQPQRQLNATDGQAREPFYPGACAAFALSDVQLLQVDTRPIAFLLDALPGTLAGYELSEEPWLARFLDSQLMRRLDTDRWQQVVRGMSPLQVERGDAIVRQGDSGDCFFVIKQGQVVVHRGRESLAYLGIGDVFGEDALIAGAPRNASVTALSNTQLMQLPRRAFLELLVHGVVPYVSRVECHPAHMRILSVEVNPAPGTKCIPLADFRLHCQSLSREHSYYVTGSHVRARALAVFLLLQRGYRAWVLLDDASERPHSAAPVMPAPCVPVPSSAVD